MPVDTLSHVLFLRIKHKFRQRIVEWVGSFEITFLGLILLSPESTFATSDGYLWMARFANESTWGLIFTFVGITRLIGLIINGSIEAVTPWIRTAGAVVGFVMFSMICTSLLVSRYVLMNPPAASLSMYVVAAGAEVAAIYCAVIDARVYQNDRRIKQRPA